MAARSRSAIALLVLVVGFLVVPESIGTARACASQHLSARLDGFTEGPAPPHFYMTAEDQSPAPFTIWMEVDGCTSSGPTPATVDWDTTAVTAASGLDYQPTSGPSGNVNDPPCGAESHCYPTLTVNVPIVDDNSEEAVSEVARIDVSTTSGRVFSPSFAPLHIVDEDGSSRIAFGQPLATQPYAQQEFATSARIPVFRAGDASAATTVTFSLAGTGTSPATPGVDFSPSSGQISFAAGDRLEFVRFSVSNDSAEEPDEALMATLTGPGVTDPATEPFTIIDEDDDDAPPLTRFHHPRQGLTYRYNDYRIREMHTFFSDPGGSGVVKAWLALRRQLLNGSCAWYNGSRFKPGRCGAKKWLPMTFSAPDLYLHRVRALRPSKGTTIKNYTAWTRGQDGAGNLETAFKRGRNLSTFEVKRR